MQLFNFFIFLNNYAPDAVERLIMFFCITFVLIIIDTIMKLFSLTVTKHSLWHYKTIINVFWGGWGQQKSSRVFYRGFVFKLFEYSLLCLFAFGIDVIKIPVTVHNGFGQLMDAISIMCYLAIVLTELWSFKENYMLIKYNHDIISKLDKSVLDKFESVSFGELKLKLREKKDD
jgi:hypothetical protein